MLIVVDFDLDLGKLIALSLAPFFVPQLETRNFFVLSW